MPINFPRAVGIGSARPVTVGRWRLPDDLDALNDHLEGRSAADILSWARDAFGDGVVASSSFQTQSVPLLHLISTTTPDMEVLFLDTGFHFPETLSFRDRLAAELAIRIRNLTAQQSRHGSSRGDLYHSDPDMCCYINKVEPLDRALAGKTAWVTGIRRDQTSTRAEARIVGVRPDGVYKIAPLLAWTDDDVSTYIRDHQLPEHPLTGLGYLSIGCAPCTRPVGAGEDARAGRWSGLDKTECGIQDTDDPSGSS
jgi:phosphoadenosine phosphosulfate reductase